jgi:ATP-dependent DNA helicase HFM1/MER3
VSRLKVLKPSVRIIAVSATFPNLRDCAEWLQLTTQGSRAFQFGEEFRPVKLDVKVLPYRQGKNAFLFDRFLNYQLLPLIRKYGEGKPVLVFCATRKGTVDAALQVLKDAAQVYPSPLVTSREQQQALQALSMQVEDREAKECLSQGVGIHTAALSLSDRRVMEKAFGEGTLKHLFCTSTLAMGVNLPASMVIVKNTEFYKPGAGYQEYSTVQVLQFVGRAGRPQYGESLATALVLCKEEVKQKYLDLFAKKKDIESQ